MSIFLNEELNADTIRTDDDVGVTRYSKFLLSCVQKMDIEGKKVCDFGSGTGVIGIACGELGAKHVAFVETNPIARNLTAENATIHLPEMVFWKVYSDIAEISMEHHVIYDLVICNPSSLPTNTAVSSKTQFYAGGLLGLDMIKAMLSAASILLKPGGQLVFLLTTLSDYKSVIGSLSNAFTSVEVSAVKQFEFRPHYDQHRDYWESLKSENIAFFFSDGESNAELVFFISAEK